MKPCSAKTYFSGDKNVFICVAPAADFQMRLSSQRHEAQQLHSERYQLFCDERSMCERWQFAACTRSRTAVPTSGATATRRLVSSPLQSAAKLLHVRCFRSRSTTRTTGSPAILVPLPLFLQPALPGGMFPKSCGFIAHFHLVRSP